jgi:hypothetical protein
VKRDAILEEMESIMRTFKIVLLPFIVTKTGFYDADDETLGSVTTVIHLIS